MKTMKKTRAHPVKSKIEISKASKRFAEEYGDVSLALEIMRNAKLSKPRARYRTNRLVYRSL
jgi:hypothetical protein